MKVIKEGSKAPPPWKKVVTCDFETDNRLCGAIFEITKKDCLKSEFGNQDDRCTDYTHFIKCPTCKSRIHVPKLDYSQKWR